jgi:uncharacterized membrane protein
VPPPAPPHAAAPRPTPAAPKSLEFYFITGFIIIGAITLALAAIFLVKMGIENGFFGPLQRDYAGVIAALVFIGVGQWRRRFEGFWSQGSTAAGIVAMFASIFAATTLHHFMHPITGFVCLAVMTAATVAMSLQNWAGTDEGGRRGGMLIATLGLIGGFITPILVNSGHDNVPGLFGYLILLHIGLIASTRIRGWSVLAAASVVLSSLWLIFWAIFKWVPGVTPSDGPILGMFMLATVASLVISTVSQPDKWRGGKGGLAAMALTWMAVGLGMLASCLLLGRSNYDDLQWAFFAALVVGAFVLARLRPIYEGMAWLASIAVLVMLAAWGVTSQGLLGLHVEADPAAALRLQGWMMGFGIATVLAAYACQWKSKLPMRWALLANLLALAYVAVAYWILPPVPRPDAWAFLPLIAALGLSALTLPMFIHRAKIATAEQALTCYAHAILALLVMAPPMALHDGALTAAWAALLPLTALAIWRLRLPGLLAGFLGVMFIVSARALMLASVFDAGGEGRNLFWNPVIWCYGTTFLAMALSAWMLERAADLPERLRGLFPSPKVMTGILQVGATAAAFLLLTLEVRWFFHDGKLSEHSVLLMERGTFAIGWLLMAATWIGKQLNRRLLVRVGEVIAIIGVVYAVAGLVIITNPLWWQGGIEDVGTMRVLNLLVFVYGLPAAACGLLAWVIRRADPEKSPLANLVGIAGLVLLFMMVTLQVRQGFVGPRIGLDTEHLNISFSEFATYAIAWMGLGAICLAIGRRFSRQLLARGGIILSGGGIAYAIIIVGLLMSPVFHHTFVGDWVILNQLLYAYGTPILLAALVTWIADPRSTRLFGPPIDDKLFAEGIATLGQVMRGGGLILLFILVTTEVRQWFQGGYLADANMQFVERGTYPVIWLALATLLLVMGYFGKSSAMRRGGIAIATIAMGFVLLVSVVFANPLWTPTQLGEFPIFNGLLYAYGLPALLCGVIAYLAYRRDPQNTGFVKAAGVMGFILLFVTASLEIRQGFFGSNMEFQAHQPIASFTELGTYGVIWMSLGALCLAAGLRFRSGLFHQAGAIFTTGGLAFACIITGFLMNPICHAEWVGDWTIFNHLLFAYGTPLVLAALTAWIVDPRAARIFRPSFSDRSQLVAHGLGQLTRLGVAVLLFILATTELRQAFQGSQLNLPEMNFFERGSYAAVWLALAGALLPIGYMFNSQTARRTGLTFAGVAIGFVLLICTLAMNPLLTHESVGGIRIFNGLLLTYGIPAAAAAILAWALWNRGTSERVFAWICGIASLLLTLVLVTLQVQHLFRGDHLAWSAGPGGEFTAYSLAWAMLGFLYLIAGIIRKSAILRWASLLMMLLTIVKVFIFDMADLHDLERVLSFAGLGLSLMALAFVYQRFVFKKTPVVPQSEPTQAN